MFGIGWGRVGGSRDREEVGAWRGRGGEEWGGVGRERSGLGEYRGGERIGERRGEAQAGNLRINRKAVFILRYFQGK